MKYKAAGFTLIEVMLALAVFAMAGTALLKATGAGLNSVDHLKQATLANWVAANQLVEVSLDERWPPQNNRKGKTELAGIEWYWRQVVKETQASGLRSVTIEVSLSENSDGFLAAQTTYLAQPVKARGQR